ncbi:hypothetical protein GF325_14455 [Candidatus Bathyarchaeota archaeon]|nr:hypothetical protein [Candidatus Bathyarchaeota archaeon]
MSEKDAKYMSKIDMEGGVADDAVLVVGIANAGLVGNISSDYIIDKLQMKEIGYMNCTKFPPVAVFLDGKVKHPFRLYADSTTNPAKRLVAVSEVPLQKESLHDLAHALMDHVSGLGVTTVVTLIGILVDIVDEIVVLYASDDGMKSRLDEIESIKPIPKGMTFGMEALILNEAIERDINGLALIAPVQKHIPATGSAAKLIEALNEIFPFFNIDVEDLLERDEQIKSKLQELAEQIRNQQNKMSNKQQQGPPASTIFT